MSAITISVRVDVFSMLYAMLLGILLLMSRRANARFWPLYIIILVILLPVQFLSTLGLPLFLCEGKCHIICDLYNLKLLYMCLRDANPSNSQNLEKYICQKYTLCKIFCRNLFISDTKKN